MIAQAVLLVGASASNRQKLKLHLAAALDEANPIFKTLLAVVGAADLKLSVPR